MNAGRPDEPIILSTAEQIALDQLEGRLAAEDRILDQKMRTGRRVLLKADPVHAGIAASAVTLPVLLIVILCGAVIGVAAAGVALIALPIWLLLCRRFSTPGQTGFR